MTPVLLTCLLTLSPLLACGDKDDDTGGTGGDGGSSDGGTDGGSADGGGEVEGARLAGRVVMEGGTPASVQVRLCEELCRTASTDAEGNFEYLGVEAGHYALEAVYLTDQNGYSTPLDFITLDQDEDRTLTTDIVVRAFQTKAELSAGTQLVDLDGGLTVTVDPANLTASSANSPYLASGDADYIAAVSVGSGNVSLPLEDVQGEIVAAWFMGRMSVVADPPLPFVSTELYGLNEGESVRVVAADYDTKSWLDGGTATVTGGRLIADQSSGIPALSTVLFLRE